MSTAAVLIGALLLDAALGEPRWLWARLPHPAVIFGRLIGWCDDRWNTGDRRRAKGAAVLMLLVVGAGIVGSVIQFGGPLLVIPAAAILLAQKSLVQHVQAVADGLRLSLGDGRRAVSMIVSRDTGGMDESQAARAAIESAAENLSDGVIAPAFWFLVAGMPGLLIYKIVNTADSMIGYRTPRHEAFGWAAARTDDVMNLLPARMTAVMIALVSGVTSARAIRTEAGRHRSPNAGWPEAAMARALGVALSGPRAYHGQKRDFAWVNPEGRRSLHPRDIDGAVAILWRTWALGLALCVILAMTV